MKANIRRHNQLNMDEEQCSTGTDHKKRIFTCRRVEKVINENDWERRKIIILVLNEHQRMHFALVLWSPIAQAYRPQEPVQNTASCAPHATATRVIIFFL